MYSFQSWIKAKQIPSPALPQPNPRYIPLTLCFYYVFIYKCQPEPVKQILDKTICQPRHDSLTLGLGLNVCLCATCNATHTALSLGTYLSAFPKLHADIAPIG